MKKWPVFPNQDGTWRKVVLDIRGDQLSVTRDATEVGTVPLTEPSLDLGRVVLGISAPASDGAAGPYKVGFRNVEIRGQAV